MKSYLVIKFPVRTEECIGYVEQYVQVHYAEIQFVPCKNCKKKSPEIHPRQNYLFLFLFEKKIKNETIPDK